MLNHLKELLSIMAKSHYIYAFVVVFGSLIASSDDRSISPERDQEKHLQLSISLSVCMEIGAVANEIEITDSAIKRAIRKVSGIQLRNAPNPQDSSEECSLKLV